MVLAEIDKTRTNEVLHKGITGDVPVAVSPPDTQLQIHPGIPPLTSYTLQQSPQLGESSRQLAEQKSAGQSWSSTILRTISLPSMSGALNYILKRAAFVPSVLYRKIDLPLFRRRFKPGTVSTQSGKAVPDRQQNTSLPQTDESPTEIPLYYPVDKEEEQPSRISDEGYPAIIKNLFSPPAALNRMVDTRNELHIINATPMVTTPDTVDQASATDDPVTSHDNERKSSIKDTFKIKESRQIADNRANTNPNQSTKPGEFSRYLHTDQIPSRTSAPFRQRISRQREISEKNKTGDPVRDSLDISTHDSSAPHTINVQEKPIGTTIRQVKPTPFIDKSYVSLSEEVPAHYDIGSYQVADSGQAAISEDQTSPDTAFKQNIPTTNRADSRKSGKFSMPRAANNLYRQPLKSSPLKKTELSGEISDDYYIDSRPMTDVKKSTSSKSETIPVTTSQQTNLIVDKTISRITNQPSIPPLSHNIQSLKASSLQKTKSSEKIVTNDNNESQPLIYPVKSTITKPGTLSNIIAEQNANTIDRAVSRKSGQSPIPAIPDNHTGKALPASPPQKIESSEEMDDENNNESQPVIYPVKSTIPKSSTLSNIISKQNANTTDKNVSRNSGQSSIQKIPDDYTRQSSIVSPLQKTEASEDLANNYNDDLQPVISPEKSITTEYGTLSNTVYERNTTAINKAVSRMPSQSSIQEIPGNYTRQSSITSPAQKTEPSEEVVDEYNIESQPVTGREKSITTESGTLSNIISEQNANSIDRTVSRNSDQSSIQKIPGSYTKQPLIASSPLRIAYNKEASLITGILADAQANNVKRARTEKYEKARAIEGIQRTSETTHIPEDTNNITYNHDRTNMVSPKQDGIDEGTVKINMSTPLFYLRTHVSDSPNIRTNPSIGNISSQIAPISQRIFRSTGFMASSETNENDVVLRDNENILPSLGYRHTSQQLLNLPVVSPVQPKTYAGPAHPEELFRTISDALPEMTRPKSYSTPDLALVPAARTAEPASADQTIVNRQQIENTNDQAAAPNIRIIADKVYALLRQELKIERERERHRLLR